MKITYITEPKEQYVTRQKTAEMKYTRTTYHCPMCKEPSVKREFEAHVFKKHARRVDEVFAMLYGMPYPVRCSCGKELHYSQAHKGFPTSCGTCDTGCVTQVQYKNAEDAHKHYEQLMAMVANAKYEEKRLKLEEELSKVPLSELPFPTKKDPRMLKRISMDMRVYAINGEKQKLLDLANFIDSRLAQL